MTDRTVVITGTGAITPLGEGVDALWTGLLAGRSGVRNIDDLLADVPHSDEYSTRIAAPLPIDPASLLDRVKARRLDRSEQSALVAAREAWTQAGSPEVDPFRLATVIGTGIGGLITLLTQDDIMEQRGPSKMSPLTVPMLMANGAAAVVSIDYGAKGGVFTPVSACASGAEAIAQGVRMIRAGEADVVIAGGAEAAIAPLTLGAFAQARTLSRRNDDPEGASRPFDIGRDGFVLGEGAGMVILESAEFASSRGATVLGRVAGYGITSDAYHVTGPDPSGAGQARAMLASVSDAGLSPADVQHVNCHATSTVVGDPGEAAAIRSALGDEVLLTAPKSSIGHLVGAAGAVEAIITMLSVTHGVIPQTLNLEAKDPKVILPVVSGAPQEVQLTAAICNSFGFGGQNVSLLFTA